jgi:hypothetical protein
MPLQIRSFTLADARNLRRDPAPPKTWDPPPRRWDLGRLAIAVVLFVIVALLLI